MFEAPERVTEAITDFLEQHSLDQHSLDQHSLDEHSTSLRAAEDPSAS